MLLLRLPVLGGAYGVRFKEVARQIKDLANRANQATGQAQVIIETVQQSSREVLTEVVGSQLQVERVSASNNSLHLALSDLEQSALRVNESVNRLLGLAEEVNHKAYEIKHVTAQQKTSSSQSQISRRSSPANCQCFQTNRK